jgi:hypothetical protein
MRKIAHLLAIMASIVIIPGCGNKLISDRTNSSPVQIERNAEEQKKGTQESKANKIEFNEVKENELPGNMANSIKLLKPNRGYFYEEAKDAYYIAIFSGKKTTGGFSIKVKSVEDVEGKTYINVEEFEPKPNAIVTQAITYPYTIIKVSKITQSFIVKSTEDEIFEKMKKEWQEY